MNSPERFSFWQWLRRYVSVWTVVCIGVMLFVLFYGDHSVLHSIDYDNTIDSLRAELQANRDTTEYYRRLNERLKSDPELMEQVVREQYGMKKANEEVYIFTEPED